MAQGPYRTKHDAEFASGAPQPHVAPGYNLSRLNHALSEAGVSVGMYDHEVLEWLSTQEPAVVESIAAMIDRAGDDDPTT